MYALFYILMISSSFHTINAIFCGFPGRPAYGRALQVTDSYSEGQAVTYTCNSGYYMVGTVIRRCLPNGTWTGNIPVCDTTLSPVGYTSSSEPLALYPPEMAVDNNKKSCFYSNRRKPRWWRMDMGVVQTVLSVAITVPFASSEHHFTIYVIEVNDTLTKYHKCASFRGIFSSQAMILSCGNMKGIVGSVLHIEDDSPHLDHFGLCEVEVFVRKDFYECGQPEIPTNSYLIDKPNHVVTYDCFNGYKLEGSRQRSCMRNGQWTGSQPICRQINCAKPVPIENGNYRLNSLNTDNPELGSRVIYSCKLGHTLTTINDTHYCQENATWSGVQPQCNPVDCGLPIDNSDYLGGRFQLLNHSTKYQSKAELICFNGKRLGLIIQCRDDGSWNELDTTCIYSKVNPYNTSESLGKKSNKLNITTLLVSAILAVLFILILLILVLFKKNVLQFKWATEPMAAPRRSSWALEAFRSANIQLRKPFRLHQNCAVSVKTQSIPSNSSIKSVSSKLDNIYEEIANINANPITDETEDKIRRAALIAAELAAINEQKQILQANTKSMVPQSPPLGLYAKVDLIQKHKDRLLREQRLKDMSTNKEISDNTDTNISIDYHMSLRQTTSSPDMLSGHSSGNYESIAETLHDFSRPQKHILKDNMIFVGHPCVDVNNCDNLSQVTQSGTNSELKRVYSITS